MSEEFPESIKDFLRRYISSVGHLDILLLLYKDPERKWTVKEVSQELRTNLSLAEDQLKQLNRSGLVMEEQGFYQCCRELEIIRKVESLLQFYHLKRQIVIEFIYTQPLDRIRSFADAFKIKKD